MDVTGLDFFDTLREINEESNSIKDKYPKMRSLLEKVCKDLTREETIQFSNLFSRLNHVCQITNLDKRKTYQINTLRINANKVLHAELNPTKEDYLQDLKALCNAISHFYGVGIHPELAKIIPETDTYKPIKRPAKNPRIRVGVIETDSEFIYAIDEENASEEPVKIKHHVNGINGEFDSTVAKLWKGCQLNLIDVTIDENGYYVPDFIVLEPDYLIDISSLAENFKDYGSHALNYMQAKFDAIANSAPLLLGNYANNVFDEFLFATKYDAITFREVFIKTFRQYPFEFSTCEDLLDADKENKFKEDVKKQFINIQKTVSETFNEEGYKINRQKSIVEPSFICEKLGIQGRMDFLQDDLKNLIELKSGKADDFHMPLKSKQNNYIQMLLYLGVLEYNLDKKHADVKSYLFYSRYPQLYEEKPAWNFLKKAINVRNLIVCNEHDISLSESNSRDLIRQLTPEELNTRNTQGVLWDRYQRPQIIAFKEVFDNSGELELKYFHSFFSFVTREHYLSKTQTNKLDEERDTSYWLDFDLKKQAGEILYDLSISADGNKTNVSDTLPTITLSIPEYDQDFLPNFRVGDIVILYERNNQKDNVTNKQIFKGSIQELSPREITVRIRYKQKNPSVLPGDRKYAVEHDFLDSSYGSMYRGLYSFLQGNQDRKDLFLGKMPTQDKSKSLIGNYENVHGIINNEINDVVLKAKQANDYFLLLGPPGTGKTSMAIKSMVEEFLTDPANNILLLSYTNRAVDEICNTLDKVTGSPAYMRIGSELSCEPTYRGRLLDEVIAECDTREKVRTKIQEHRIFVGTVSTISNKTALFKLKQFQVAIIDEASQILEPGLTGILSAKNKDGGNAINKFILIGDQKQLPAVVLQKEEDSQVEDKDLNQIGLFNRRNSLFERLYSFHKHDKKSLAWGLLHKQGRMHPDIALFPNYSFYNSQLQAVPLEHQISPLPFNTFNLSNACQKLISSKRLVFIPSLKNRADKNEKTNSHEARIASSLLKNIYDLYLSNNLRFSPEVSVGIITPFRSQIALIKRQIHGLGIPVLNQITVDTVERFQGSQRDVIIYSFSVNQLYQLEFLANNIEDEGQIIDRKLNVAITRARKQLFIIGNPAVLSNNLTYFRLIEFIRSKAGYIKSTPDDFVSGKFSVEEPDTDVEIGGSIYEPDPAFVSTFDKLVIQPVKEHPKTHYPNLYYGHDHDYNRLNVIKYGRANFDEATLQHSASEKVNLYCIYNMRKHYFSAMAIFKSFNDYFKAAFTNSNNRITFIDFGCGPMTSGLAFNQNFSVMSNFHFNYLGVDISRTMLEKAKQFSDSDLFNHDSKFQFVKSLDDVSNDHWESLFQLPNTVILNFSYLFGNLNKADAEELAGKINSLLDQYKLNKYVLVFQNSSLEKRNRTYDIFKQLVPRLSSVTSPKTETITYKNSVMSNFDKSETVFYELLSN